jgi:TP53 regulating kinase-like protein
LKFHGEAKLLYKGAEADIYICKWCGEEAILKLRKKLGYRNTILDKTIRMQRTVREATIIARVKKAGVRSPHIYYLDPRNAYIVMEFIKGKRLRELLLNRKRDYSRLCHGLGEVLARMHRINIMHGDLTTSNIIVTNKDIAVIDFGLSHFSTRIEDMATDVRLVKEVMSSVHSSLFPECFDFFLKGYEGILGRDKTKLVKSQLSSIERRGRYAKLE